MKLTGRRESKNATGLTRAEKYRQERERRQRYYEAIDRLNATAKIDPSVSQDTMYPGTSITDFANENMVKTGTLGIDHGRTTRFGTKYQTLGPPVASKFTSVKTRPGPIGQYAALPAEGMYSISYGDPKTQARMDAKVAQMKADIGEYARDPQVRNPDNKMWADQGMMPSNAQSMRAKTVAQVVAAEAGGKTRKDRLQAMKDVFSAAYNRAVQTGVSIKDVVSVKSQFNAYNSVMPAGTVGLVGLAQQAIDSVLANGPTHKGTYYARSYATKNLPHGLKAIKTAVDDHVYYSDPKNRAIVTAAGAKKPSITRAALPDVKSSLPSQVSSVPQHAPSRTKAATPGFNMGTIAAQGALRTALNKAPNTLASASTTPGSFPGMSISKDTASPRTMATLGGISGLLSKQPAPNTLAQVARPTLARSFTPTGPLNSNIYTPSTPSAVTPDAGYADPMQVAAAREWGTAQNLPSNPAPASYADVQKDYAARQAATKAKSKAGTELAGTAAASIGDTIGGFFDSVRGETAAAAIGPEVNRTTPKTDRLQRTATVDEVLAGKPVKTTTVKPEAIYDDPRALAYAEDMQLKPVDAVLPSAVTEDVLPETLAQPKRVVQRVRQPLQLTVRAPRQQFAAPSMPGGTLGGIRAQDRFNVGTGLQGITSAMGGLRGATGFSRTIPGVSVTSRGRTLGTITRNEKFGTTTFRDPTGNVTGVHYDGGIGARLGHTLGSIFGGSSSSGKSSGSSSGGSGKSGSSGNGARGAAGGSLGQSQHSL